MVGMLHPPPLRIELGPPSQFREGLHCREGLHGREGSPGEGLHKLWKVS